MLLSSPLPSETRPGAMWSAQVQGLGDVLEIEENLAPGDDGVKIQERIADWFACSVNGVGT